MSSPRPAAVALIALAALALLSCTDATAPDTRSLSELRLLHTQPGTPALVSTQLSFYAVKGRSADVDLFFHAAPGRTDSMKLLEFRMGPGSLDRRPDGSVIAVGDSVLITLTVVDPVRLVTDFQPSGLLFSATDRPTFRFFWDACGDDLNYDGRIDAGDDAIIQQLGIWRQEAADQPWLRLLSTVVKSTKQVSTQLSGFSGYALAY